MASRKKRVKHYGKRSSKKTHRTSNKKVSLMKEKILNLKQQTAEKMAEVRARISERMTKRNILIGSVIVIVVVAAITIGVIFSQNNPSHPLPTPPAQTPAPPAQTPAPPVQTPVPQKGLSSGAIAGIVIGSVVGFLLLMILLKMFMQNYYKDSYNKALTLLSLKNFLRKNNEEDKPLELDKDMKKLGEDIRDAKDEIKQYSIFNIFGPFIRLINRLLGIKTKPVSASSSKEQVSSSKEQVSSSIPMEHSQNEAKNEWMIEM